MPVVLELYISGFYVVVIRMLYHPTMHISFEYRTVLGGLMIGIFKMVSSAMLNLLYGNNRPPTKCN